MAPSAGQSITGGSLGRWKLSPLGLLFFGVRRLDAALPFQQLTRKLPHYA